MLFLHALSETLPRNEILVLSANLYDVVVVKHM